MCGIAGIATWKRGDNRELVRRMCSTLVHRGPDGEGVHQSNGCCLGHRRLSIIDLSHFGDQPMSNEDGGVWVTLNGELYGFALLRQELEQKGHLFKSRTDTEVLLHGYEEWGIVELCSRLTGMFAFALWDEKAEMLFLARDRFGEKPLYFMRRPNEVRFASNTHSLFVRNAVTPELEPEVLISYLDLCYSVPQKSILQNVETVQPGTVVILQKEKCSSTAFWSWSKLPSIIKSAKSYEDQIEQCLKQSVSDQLVADVPVGCLVSGGVDSSLIASFAVELKPDIELFTVQMMNSTLDESAKASVIANELGVKHHILEAYPPSPDEFTVYQSKFSEPLGDASSIAVWMIAKYARSHVKVMLTGDGGDELFAGYSSLMLNLWADKYRKLGATPLARVAAKILSQILPAQDHFIPIRKLRTLSRLLTTSPMEWYATISYVPVELRSRLFGPQISAPSVKSDLYGDMVAETWGDRFSLLDQLSLYDIQFPLPGDYLRKVDTGTMAWSLEARSPLLNHRLAAIAFSIPATERVKNGESKSVLKRLLKKRLGHSSSVALGRKEGFVVPIDDWLNGQWNFLLSDLRDSPLIKEGFLLQAGVELLLLGASNDPARFSRLRYSVVALHTWYNEFRRSVMHHEVTGVSA